MACQADPRVTSVAIIYILTETFWGPPMVSGVTVNLNIDYFHPAPVYVDFFPPPPGQPVAPANDRGTKIRVDVTIVKLTTTLANTLCEVRLP